MEETIGWIGTALVIVAYFPQIRHLFVKKCAWGISLWTWVIWLVASAMLLTYAWMRDDALFILVQFANVSAIAATIVLVLRSDRVCRSHFSSGADRGRGRRYS